MKTHAFLPAMLLTACAWAAPSRAAQLASQPAPSPDDLATATQRGQAMLQSPKWSLPIDGLINDSVTLYNAGDYVICTPASTSTFPATVVEKATGKQASNNKVRILCVTGENGGAMFLRQSTRTPNADLLRRTSLIDTTSRWDAELPLYTDSALLSGTQIFTGAAVPGMKPGPRPPVGDPAGAPTSTKVTLEIASFDAATGKRQWTYSLPPNTLQAAPSAWANGVLYLLTIPAGIVSGVRPSALIGLNTADGTQLFIRESRPADTGPAGASSRPEKLSNIAVTGDQIIAVTDTGELLGLDAKTGQEKWRQHISLPGPAGNANLTWQDSSNNVPIIADNKIIVSVFGATVPVPSRGSPSRDNKMAGLAAFDAKTHQQLWFFRSPEDVLDQSTPLNSGVRKRAQQLVLFGVQAEKDHLIALAAGSRTAIVGINLHTGKLDWLIPTHTATPAGPDTGWMPLLSGDTVYLVKDSKLLAIPLPAK